MLKDKASKWQMQEHYWSKEVQHISEKYYIRDLYQLKLHIQRHKAVTCDLDKKDHCTKGHCSLRCGRIPNLLKFSRTFSIWSRSWLYFNSNVSVSFYAHSVSKHFEKIAVSYFREILGSHGCEYEDYCFWDVRSCSSVDYQGSVGKCYLHLLSWRRRQPISYEVEVIYHASRRHNPEDCNLHAYYHV